MPYITTKQVAGIREQLKKSLPDYKLSITREHSSGVNISIISGPIDFFTHHSSVNHFYIKDHYTGEAARVLTLISEVAENGNKDVCEDADYGKIPSWYVNIEIGKWNKPYVQIVATVQG